MNEINPYSLDDSRRNAKTFASCRVTTEQHDSKPWRRCSHRFRLPKEAIDESASTSSVCDLCRLCRHDFQIVRSNGMRRSSGRVAGVDTDWRVCLSTLMDEVSSVKGRSRIAAIAFSIICILQMMLPCRCTCRPDSQARICECCVGGCQHDDCSHERCPSAAAKPSGHKPSVPRPCHHCLVRTFIGANRTVVAAEFSQLTLALTAWQPSIVLRQSELSPGLPSASTSGCAPRESHRTQRLQV